MIISLSKTWSAEFLTSPLQKAMLFRNLPFCSDASSVASGEAGVRGYSPPIGLKSMQNIPFLALLRPIFAIKTKIDPPPGIGDDNWSRIRCDIEQKNWVSAWLKTFFLSFFLKSRKFGQKKRPNFGGYLFLLLEITNIWRQKPTQFDQRPIKV